MVDGLCDPGESSYRSTDTETDRDRVRTNRHTETEETQRQTDRTNTEADRQNKHTATQTQRHTERLGHTGEHEVLTSKINVTVSAGPAGAFTTTTMTVS